jgi:hypothetical protein
VSTTPGIGFDGVGEGFTGPNGTYTDSVAPPDTNGSVGATQYVQWVNTSFAVFDKTTGAVLEGPLPGNTFWSGFGGSCETRNDGDIIAQYDKVANRWVMMQPVFASPYMICIAVSTTSDATGSYYRYAFSEPNFPDYPKLAVWPDGYYMSFNMFQGNTFQGARACAMDRSAMLTGAAATQQCFQLTSSSPSLLPSDLDGTTPPPAGSPDYYLNFGTNSLNLWKFHVDFQTPGNSTFTGPTNLAVAAFTPACSGGVCIPQTGTTQLLDSLADRLMYRLAYRNFPLASPPHESLVVNHSVDPGSGNSGIRWYELRNPGGSPTVYQQGTFAPDSEFRWMGSIAMDRAGDILVGYSVSSSSMHPAIRYTGRVPSDPLGTLEGETSILEGTGSQTRRLSRWGDYSSMSVDPVDDCTLWYTQEYLKANGTFNWSTRIASASFPNCSAAPPSVVSVTPSSGSGLGPQTFGFVYSDANGFTSLNTLRAQFTSKGDANSCLLRYIRSANSLYLLNDAASSWLGPMTLGAAGTLQNSQCSVNMGSSSATGSGNSLTLNLSITFNSSFAGTQNIWMKADDNGGQTSGWQFMGSWSVPPTVNQPPSVISVTPNTGSGLGPQTFSFVYSDPNGFSFLTAAKAQFTSQADANSCFLEYIRSANSLYLLNDAASSWLGPMTLGAAGTLQNSQCSVNIGSSSATGSGNSLTLNLSITFNSSFAGTQNIWMKADDNGGQTSGWQFMGSWSVP